MYIVCSILLLLATSGGHLNVNRLIVVSLGIVNNSYNSGYTESCALSLPTVIIMLFMKGYNISSCHCLAGSENH